MSTPSTDVPSHDTPSAAAPPRRTPRLAAAAAGALLALVAGATGAVASHEFADVRSDSVFHEAVDWMVDAGITQGYGDGTFGPSDGVTRAQMAAFLQRGAPRMTTFVDALAATSVAPTSSPQLVATLGTFTKASDGTALDVELQTQTRTSDAGIGSCRWQLRVDGVAASETVVSTGGGDVYEAGGIRSVFTDVAAGEHDVALFVVGSADSCLADVGGWDDLTTVTEFVHAG